MLRKTAAGWEIDLHVQPNARCTAIDGVHGDAIKVRVQSPPVDGKANDELQRWLAECFAVKRADVVLLRGSSSRRKCFAIHTAQPLPECLRVFDCNQPQP